MAGTFDNTQPARRLKVFLCHSSTDKARVREIYHRLRASGLQPWLDEEELIPGQDWREEIPKAVRGADVVIVCLSRNSVSKTGYVQKEIKHALDVADEQPEGAIFIIPVKLEECEVPNRLSQWQWANVHQEDGYERLLRALKTRADVLGIQIPSHDQRLRPWTQFKTVGSISIVVVGLGVGGWYFLSRNHGSPVSSAPATPTAQRISPAIDEKAVSAQIAKGDFHYERGKFDRSEYDLAIDEYTRGLSLDPSNTVLQQKLDLVRRTKDAVSKGANE
jgi:hypothetical protein